MTRRAALLARKSKILAVVQTAIDADDTMRADERATFTQLSNTVDLILDVLIDIAHPVGGGEDAVPSMVSELAAGFKQPAV